MKGTPTGFWGKLEWPKDAPGPIAWHPLLHHCADVAACFEALIELPLLRRRIARFADCDDIEEVSRQRLCAIVGLHDIGKVNHGFQNKGHPGRRRWSGHVGQALGFIFSDSSLAKAMLSILDVELLAGWFEDPVMLESMLIAAISHHGRPVNPISESADPRLWLEGGGRNPIAEVGELVSNLRRWFPLAFVVGGPRLNATPELQHAFSGLLMLADWLGSDGERFFPFSTSLEDDRMPFARKAAKNALRATGFDPLLAVQTLQAEMPSFKQACGFEPRPAQQRLAEIDLPATRSITVLEDETGAGKTEAALYYFLRLFHSRAIDGLYFALPTRTAATQIYDRICDTVARVFHDCESRPPVVLAVPGYLRVDGVEGIRLPHFRVLWPDDENQRLRYRAWAAEHPKRYLAGAVVVGTIDQVLLSGLAVNHADMRAAALLRHLLVVDEVHASDAFMTRLLQEVLSRHLKAGGHTLLMSATLGADARQRLLHPEVSEPSIPDQDTAVRQSYPAISDRSSSDPRPVIPYGVQQKIKTVRVAMLHVGNDTDSASVAPFLSRAISAASDGACVLVIRNTVRDCMATQQYAEDMVGDEELLMRCQGIVAPHHSRFAREDRRLLDQAIESRFGKDGERRGVIAIATQTVQQSLDLDADLLISDLCPMDVLLQRIGRLHRHERSRPQGFNEPQVIVLIPQERDLTGLIHGGEARGAHGIGTVYDDLRVIEATWRQLEANPVLAIPVMNRALVEKTTHPTALSRITSELGEAWKKHHEHIVGITIGDRNQALRNRVDWSCPFGDSSNRWLFPDEELDQRIKTRLGEDDRIVNLKEHPQGPFGHGISVITIPSFMAEGIAGDAEAEVEAAGRGALRITLGKRRYLYDRIGLQPEEEAVSTGAIEDR